MVCGGRAPHLSSLGGKQCLLNQSPTRTSLPLPLVLLSACQFNLVVWEPSLLLHICEYKADSGVVDLTELFRRSHWELVVLVL